MTNWPPTVRVHKWRQLRIALVFVWTVSIVILWPFLEQLAAEAVPSPPRTTNVPRIKVSLRRATEVSSDESIESVIVMDPNIVSATIQSERTALIVGLKPGQTILILVGRTRRMTYAIDVIRSPTRSGVTKKRTSQGGEEPQSFSGSQAFYVTPGTGITPSLLRYNFDYRQQLEGNRIFRTSGELFRFFGKGDRSLATPLTTNFGTNRIVLGLDSPTTRLDLLDSQLEISQLGFNGYTLRGLHLVSTANSRWPGLEFFVGNARPQLAIFSNGEGRIAGTTVPIIDTARFGVRVGAVWIRPAARHNSGGFVWHTGFRFSSDEKTKLAGDLDYSKGKLSGRAKLYMQRGPFVFSAEALHLDRDSPLITIGAQAQGRTERTVSLQWRPAAVFNSTATYTRTTIASPAGSARAEPNSEVFLFTANLQPGRRTHFGFKINHQVINLPASPQVPIPLNLETRSAVFKWGERLSHQWTNNLEARVIFSRENNTDLQTSRGITLREQIRYTGRRIAAAGFVNFRSNTPSLESLVLRNPTLLPINFRAAFISDPQRFLLTNRDALPVLLGGVDLPLTRNTEIGANVQASLRRVNCAAETIYSTGVFASAPERHLQVSVSGNLRLDAANSLQMSISRSFASTGSGDQTGLTVGYVHRFGSGSGGGFQFSKLFGIGGGQIRGRVFMDLNANGAQDADEHGLAGVKVQLDGFKTATTDARGDFKFEALEPGDFEIALISNELGVSLRASTATLHHVSLSPRQTVELTFGLTNTGYVAGRVFNDLFLTGQHDAGDAPGLKGVSLKLYASDDTSLSRGNRKSFTQLADNNGNYEFRNVPPGRYMLEIDPDTLPANFRLLSRMSWAITVAPLQRFYFDLPFAAQRAISGIVFIDRDNDEHFDPVKDSAIEGARVVTGKAEAVSTLGGLYLLRNLPAGELNVQVYSPAGILVARVHLELGPEPTLRTRVNLRIRSQP